MKILAVNGPSLSLLGLALMLLFFRMIALSLPIQTAKAAITSPGSEARPLLCVRYGPSSRGRWRAKAR